MTNVIAFVIAVLGTTVLVVLLAIGIIAIFNWLARIIK